jgi:hypothetical protein
LTIKPMTYLVSFTLFVLMFMGLGGYVGYRMLVGHFMAQSFLDATPIDVHIVPDPLGNRLCWDDRILLPQGGYAHVTANNQSPQISIVYSDGPNPSAPPPSLSNAMVLATHERAEDIRIDKARHYLYARVYSASDIKSKETTWLYKYDLRRRRLLRRASVNPLILPVPFRP